MYIAIKSPYGLCKRSAKDVVCGILKYLPRPEIFGDRDEIPTPAKTPLEGGSRRAQFSAT